jgi:hypothetical protein
LTQVSEHLVDMRVCARTDDEDVTRCSRVEEHRYASPSSVSFR